MQSSKTSIFRQKSSPYCYGLLPPGRWLLYHEGRLKSGSGGDADVATVLGTEAVATLEATPVRGRTRQLLERRCTAVAGAAGVVAAALVEVGLGGDEHRNGGLVPGHCFLLSSDLLKSNISQYCK